MTLSKVHEIDPKILEEAIDWLMQMTEQPLSSLQQEDFEQWKNQSEQHTLAWQRTEKLQQRLGNIPNEISKKTLDQPSGSSFPFGKLILLFGCGSIIAASTYLTHQQAWFADYRTPYGEQKQIKLEDGTQLFLNSKTAVDINYTAQERQIILHYGEIFIQTAKEPHSPYRPFNILGEHGTIQALGTQFNVQQQKKHTTVAVIEHAVKVDTAISHQQKRLPAGQQVRFDGQQIQTQHNIQGNDLMWRKGLIIADRTPLADFAQQLKKYYGVHIEVADDCQHLLISGTYPTDNLDRLLAALQETYALQSEQKLFGYKLLIYKKS